MRMKILAAAVATAIAALASASGAGAATQSGSGHAATGASAAAATGQTVLTKLVTNTHRINATTICKSVEGEYDHRSGKTLLADVVFSNYFCYNGLTITFETSGFAGYGHTGGWGYIGQQSFHKNCYAASGSGRPCSGNYEKWVGYFCAGNPLKGGCSAYWFPTIEQWQKFNGQAWAKLSN